MPVVLVYVVPSILYAIPAAGAGVLTVMVPVIVAQVVGCVGVTVGAAGAEGGGLIVTEVAGDVHPEFLAVTM